MQYAFEVHVSTYDDNGVYVVSQHRSPRAAARSLASVIRNKRGMHNAANRIVVWCSRDNNRYSLMRMRELIAVDYFRDIE